MSFTGSPEVGKLVAQACAANLVPVKLELGGKGAAVIFDDADVAATAKALVGAITLNSGQVCCTASRWLVHKNVYDKFVEEAVGLLRNVQIGRQVSAETCHVRIPPAGRIAPLSCSLKAGMLFGAEQPGVVKLDWID